MLMSKGALVHDILYKAWRTQKIARHVSMIILFLFTGTALASVLNMLGLLPPILGKSLPRNPFVSIQLAFTLVLFFEVIDLIFSLSESVALTVRKQLEIMSLIMLRDAFKDIGLLRGQLNFIEDSNMLLQIALTAAAGLLLFIFRCIFIKLQYIQCHTDMDKYIQAKKNISLALIHIFAISLGYDLYAVCILGQETIFFQIFYTCLIFTDIFLALIGQYFMPSFAVTFRNSGYAVGTLLMRIALGAPHHTGAILCVFSGLYILGVSWATSRLMPPPRQ